MAAPRRNSKLRHLNIHINEKDLYTCDIRIQKRDRPYVRRIRHFDDLSSAIDWRDEIRGHLGLPPAEDE